jgi:hypothetical protein
MLRRFGLAALVLALTSCNGGTSSPVDAGTGAGDVDAGVDAAAPDAGPVPVWPNDNPDTTTLGDRRGRHLARTIVHLHSPLSHDACDGMGFVTGTGLNDPACLADFRAAACTLRMDALMVTDHATHLSEVSFEDAFWMNAAMGDEAVRDASGAMIAMRMACPDGRRVLVTVGSENAMMPVGLLHHPGTSTDPAAINALYGMDGASAAQAFRDAGALVFYAHTESKTLDQIRAAQPTGIEIYNTHANVDPHIRPDYLGLPSLSYIGMLTRFTNAANRMAPDLALLSFLEEAHPDLVTWDTLLAEGMHLTGTGGCDAHENSFPQRMPDGERGDSYRRMMHWHDQHLLVDTMDRDGVMDALAHGRLYVTFEVFGTPVDFDFRAEGAAGAIAEMGDTIPVGATLHVVRPSLPAGFPSTPAPTIHIRIVRAAMGGGVEVASGDGAELTFTTTEPGAYRAEVRMVPEHTRPYLGSSATELIHEVPWVYANPIYVE